MKKLALIDLDGTIRKPKSEAIFINDPEDQELIEGAFNGMEKLHKNHYVLYGASNQVGIEAGYKTLKNTIKEMDVTLSIAPRLEKIYFAVNNNTCWVITRKYRWLDFLPLFINTPGRYRIDGGMGDNPKYHLGGFRKPNIGMLGLGISDFTSYCQKTYGKELVFTIQKIMDSTIMIGDRDEDKQAANNAGINFISVYNFLGDEK